MRTANSLRPLRLLVGLAVACLTAQPASDTAPMKALLEKADIVLVAEVAYGTYDGPRCSFTLVPRLSLKGNLNPGVAVPVSYVIREGTVQGKGEFRGLFGLWMLVRDATAGYIVLPPRPQSPPLDFAYYPLPPVAGDRQPGAANSPLIDRVFLELGSAVEQLERDRIYWHLADGVLSCLDTSATKDMRETLDRWSRSSSANLAALGLAGLVTIQDPDALARSRDHLQLIKQSQPHVQSCFVLAVLGYRNPDPGGVSALGLLATEETGVEKLTSTAVYTLRAIHTKETLPYMAKLLDSPDREIRGQAVAGFTYFVNNWPIETPAAVIGMAFTRPVANAPYRTKETDRYNSQGVFIRDEDEQNAVRFWKVWWASHQQEISNP